MSTKRCTCASCARPFITDATAARDACPYCGHPVFPAGGAVPESAWTAWSHEFDGTLPSSDPGSVAD
jgi:hypothetical protein